MNWAILSCGTTAHRFTVREDEDGVTIYDAMCGARRGVVLVNHPGNADHCAACKELDDVPGIARGFAQAFMPGAMAFMVKP